MGEGCCIWRPGVSKGFGTRLSTQVGCGSRSSPFVHSDSLPFISGQRLAVAHGTSPTPDCVASFL